MMVIGRSKVMWISGVNVVGPTSSFSFLNFSNSVLTAGEFHGFRPFHGAMGSIYGDDSDPAINEFIARFKAKFGNHPSTAHTLTGYSVIQGLARAVDKNRLPGLEAVERL